MDDTPPTHARLDFAERWLRDGLVVLRPAVSVVQTTADMTNALERLNALRHDGVQATTTHLVVHAAARALKENPGIHQIIGGNRRHRPGRVDIGLSVTGESFVTPILVIEGADAMTVAEIVAETVRRAPEAQRADQQMLRLLRRWGWIVPFGFLRRAVLRVLFTSPAFRHKGAGTFQVSTVPLEWGFASSFTTAGLLTAGQIWSRVVVVDEQPAVRPTMMLTLSVDHGVWDGRAAARFLATVKTHLESESPS